MCYRSKEDQSARKRNFDCKIAQNLVFYLRVGSTLLSGQRLMHAGVVRIMAGMRKHLGAYVHMCISRCDVGIPMGHSHPSCSPVPTKE